jgi:hypothetical protein
MTLIRKDLSVDNTSLPQLNYSWKQHAICDLVILILEHAEECASTDGP